MSNRSSRAPGPSSPARTGTSAKRASSTRRRMGVAGLGPRDAPAEGPEVVLTEQGVGRAGHGPEVERARHVPRHRGEQRVRGLVLEDQVPVAPGPGRAAGVEPGRGHLGRPHHDGGLEQGVHRPDQPGRVHVARARRRGPPGPGRARRRRSAPHRRARPGGRRPRRWRRPGPRPRCADRVGRRSPGIPPRRRRSSAAGARGHRAGPRRRAGARRSWTVLRRRRRSEPRPSIRLDVDPTPAASGAAVRSGSNRVKPVRCAPWARCRPGGGRASGCGCSRRVGPCTAGRSRRRACGPCPCPG